MLQAVCGVLVSGKTYSEVLARRRRQRAAMWARYEREQEEQDALQWLSELVAGAKREQDMQAAAFWLARCVSVMPKAAIAA